MSDDFDPSTLDFGNDISDEDTDGDTDISLADVDNEDADSSEDVATDAGEPDGDVVDDAKSDDADADDEDEADPDAEEPGESKPEEKPSKKDKGPTIPKARLDQALRKQRAAEQAAADVQAEMAALRAEIAAANAPKQITADDIKVKMAEANEALIAGDTAKAAELQAEVMASLAAKPEAPKQEAAERDIAAEVEARIEFKQTLKEMYGSYPELDENSDSFDEELAAESVDLQRAYMNRGFTLAEATAKAAQSVAKLHDLEDRTAPKAAPKPNVVKMQRDAKTKAKIEKATKAPPVIAGARDSDDDSVAFDINSASPEEFAALPKSMQDRLLGNVI